MVVGVSFFSRRHALKWATGSIITIFTSYSFLKKKKELSIREYYIDKLVAKSKDLGCKLRFSKTLFTNYITRFFFGDQVLCCGIVGYIGSQDVEPILMDGIRILQNRGYDSCGISSISPQGELITTKYASKGTTSDSIDLLAQKSPQRHSGHHIGIGHTRWATHGTKTDINAHPHTDYTKNLALVHNGTIENFLSLKKFLMEQNVTFITETDTEVIANLISWYVDQGLALEPAVQACCSRLQGTWGLAVIHTKYPNEIVVARNGSPILVGCSEVEMFVASELTVLANYTNQFFALRDGETTTIRIGRYYRHEIKENVLDYVIDASPLTPEPYEHWTLREIYEQPRCLERAMNNGGRLDLVKNTSNLGGLYDSRDLMLHIKHLLLIGCGTSLHAAMYGERLMKLLGCFDTVETYDAAELTIHDIPKTAGGLLLLSQSGETLDVIRACELAQKTNTPCFSVVNAVGSHLARLTGCGVYLNAGREVAVASTKAFTSQVSVLALIAVWFAAFRHVSAELRFTLLSSLQRLPSYVECLLESHHKIKNIAEKIKDTRTLFVLGRGLGYPAALEGALKIKEISYIHAEGFAAGSLKHGPFALINFAERTPVIIIIPSNEDAPFLQLTAEQIKGRGGYLVGIINELSPALQNLLDEHIIIPELGHLTCIIATVALQLLAYSLAVLKGINPDKPRGLAKTVTVL